MLPDFLGIGVNKAGSTWLHDLLQAHPRVWVPNKRKEVRYFSENFSRGIEWYESFFPADSERDQYDAVGEITPNYLYTKGTAERIAAHKTVTRLLLSLRDPVDRLVSSYWFRVRVSRFEGTLEDYIKARPHEVDRGRYAKHLSEYRRLFSRDQILILVFEHITKDIAAARSLLANFLGIDAALFPEGSGLGTSNRRYVPRFAKSYKRAYKFGRRLRSRDLDWVVNAAKAIGVPTIFGQRDVDGTQRISDRTINFLIDSYRDDTSTLASDYGVDCRHWKSHPASVGSQSTNK